MSFENMCSLCLEIDAPVRIIADSALLEVYKKLTNVAVIKEFIITLARSQVNAAHKPVAACSLCYWQLRKCHKLMTRCLKASKLLTNILKTGGLNLIIKILSHDNIVDNLLMEGLAIALQIAKYSFRSSENNKHCAALTVGTSLSEDSISLLNRVRNELRNDLSFTPVEIISIEDKDMENNLMKTELKEELVLSQSTEEMEVDPSTSVGHLKYEQSGDEADMALEDTQDVETQISIDEEKLECESLEEMLNVKDNNLPDEEDHEESDGEECMNSMESEGAAPTEKCVEIHEEQIENGSTLTPENNVQEKQRTRRTVVEEAPSRSVGRYMLRSTRKVTNIRQVLSNSATSITNVSVDSYNDCNTDVDNSSSKHLKKIFYCNDCGNMFDDKCLLIKHIEHHIVVKKNINRCSPRRTVLRKQRSSRTAVVNRTETHIGKDVIQCEICQRRFIKKGDLIRHLRTHTGEKPYECVICKVKFVQNTHLKRHLLIHTGEKPFECEICKARFGLKVSLNRHLLSHTGEKPFKCKICKVKLSRKDFFKNHMLKHTGGEKSFECEICEARFSQKGHLNTHLLTHTGEKPFQCDICKVKFRRKSNLKRHLLVHTGEKPFQCDVCKARFSRKGEIENHLRIHTGEKPFQCKICKVRFRRKGYLNTHLIKHKKTNI